jgi:DNA-binding GntR family transcriptional regulator
LSKVQFLTNNDVEFHRQVFELSGNQRLIDVFATIGSQIRVLSHQVVSTLYSDLGRIPERHQAIVDAIRSRDANAAEECVRAHVMSVAKRIIAAFPGDAPEPLRIPDGHTSSLKSSVDTERSTSDDVAETTGQRQDPAT